MQVTNIAKHDSRTKEMTPRILLSRPNDKYLQNKKNVCVRLNLLHLHK